MRPTACCQSLTVAGRAVRVASRMPFVPDTRAGLARVLRSSPQFGGTSRAHIRARLISSSHASVVRGASAASSCDPADPSQTLKAALPYPFMPQKAATAIPDDDITRVRARNALRILLGALRLALDDR